MSSQRELEHLMALAKEELWIAVEARSASKEILRKLRQTGPYNCCRSLVVGQFAIEDGCSYCRYEFRKLNVRMWRRVVEAYKAELAPFAVGKFPLYAF